MLPALAEIALLIFEHGPKVQGAIKSAFSPGAGVLPYMGYIGMCREIGYGFWGSRSLNKASFFIINTNLYLYPFVTVFPVWSLDRVAKLYFIILERENAILNECLLLNLLYPFKY